MTLVQLGSRVAMTGALFIGLAGGWSAAQVSSTEENVLQCPPPLMTCADDPTVNALRACPTGYRCVCVPSCPTCLDCAARVCILASPECRTACDCAPGLGCFEGKCIAGFAPVFCCEGEQCPAGEQCQHKDGRMDRCPPPPECRTACDCAPGLGCFEGKCIAGFAPVFCCEGEQCPAGEQCQHKDGRMDRCLAACVDHAWLCRAAGQADADCGDGRICACTASCPTCTDCGQPICVPPAAPPPYRCNNDGTCAQPGDRCICVSSCPACDDCALNVCVPACDKQCEERLHAVQQQIASAVERAGTCAADRDCVRIDTSRACAGTCGAAVNETYAAQVEDLIARLDKNLCTTYRADGCPFVTPRCAATRPACVEGRCASVPAPVLGTVSRKTTLARPPKYAPFSGR